MSKSKMRKILVILVCFCLCIGYAIFVMAQDSEDTEKTQCRYRHMWPGERALAMLEVQNTMSKHAYYHAAGKHLEELNDLWVSPDGPYAETAKWSNPMGVWEGYDQIYASYVQAKHDASQAALDAICELYPEIENIPENIGIGTEWPMHTQTTAIIEIAGDGKTAKGVWYSPGIANSAVIKDDGTVGISGMWFWEKYGADFVKEDGKWKLWHIQMYYDNTPEGWGDSGQPIGMVDMPEPSYENPDPYQAWTPTTLQKIQPRLPEPYYTFIETFSY